MSTPYGPLTSKAPKAENSRKKLELELGAVVNLIKYIH